MKQSQDSRFHSLPAIPISPPEPSEHHVRLPDQAARILNASLSHASGITGRGIRVAVIDSGFYPHPFYQSQGYRIQRIPTEREPFPERDDYGHGTAHLASLFTIAPGTEVLGIKCLDQDPAPAIETALALRPDVLNCAWGFNIDRPGAPLPSVLEKTHRLLQEAVRTGICVVAAAGNGQRAFPGNMPEVISVGGVYYGEDATFASSSISSRYVSSLFPGRRVPDICGLAGEAPFGRLLLVPVPPGASLAERFPSRCREGKPIYGWGLFSGTSAAASMVSGAVALMLEASPGLTPAQVKDILKTTSREVEGEPLLDVDAALKRAAERTEIKEAE